MTDYDVTTLGSTMLSLSTEAGVCLQGSGELRVDIAGSESNVAIGLAGVGKRVCWLSKVAKTPMGERVAATIRGAGVDVSRVIWCERGRNELMWVEAGWGSNRTNVTYDRDGAAIESLTATELDFEVIETSKFFHFSGITPALSESCRDTIAEAVRRARAAGVMVSCDVNYRSKLWSPEEAHETLSSLIAGIDLLIVGAKDLHTLWGRSGEPVEELRQLQEDYEVDKVILTQGKEGAAAYFGDKIMHEHAFESEVVSPIGAGDAFAAGVLYSLLNDEPELSLRRGCAMAALARESRSDYVLGGLEALEYKLASDGGTQLSR